MNERTETFFVLLVKVNELKHISFGVAEYPIREFEELLIRNFIKQIIAFFLELLIPDQEIKYLDLGFQIRHQKYNF